MTIDINQITLRQIWDTVNVSTILLSNIYDSEDSKFTNSQNIKYPSLYLLFEYGLINIYLDRSKTSLHLLFNYKKCLVDKNLTTSQFYSYIDYIINIKFFNNIEVYDNKLLRVELTIPKQYHNDVNLISQGLYSKVSNEYKLKNKISQEVVPGISNNIPRYIVRNNLAYTILTKNNVLKTKLEKMLTSSIDSNNVEFFIGFGEKEYWNDEIVTNFLEKYNK